MNDICKSHPFSAKLSITCAHFQWSIISTSECCRVMHVFSGERCHFLLIILMRCHSGSPRLFTWAGMVLLMKCLSEALHKFSHTSVLPGLAALFSHAHSTLLGGSDTFHSSLSLYFHDAEFGEEENHTGVTHLKLY